MIKHQKGRSPFIFFALTIAYTWLVRLPSIITGLGVKLGFDAAAYNQVSVLIGACGSLAAAITLVVLWHGWKECWQFIRQAFDFRTRPTYFGYTLAIPLGLHVIPHYLASILNIKVSDSLMDLIVPEGTPPGVVVLLGNVLSC